MSKCATLLLIIVLTLSSLIMVESAFAQSIPKPSVPEFTVHLVGPSFTRNTIYSLDSNTGQIVANVGYTNKYSYVILTIKNQPFNPSYGSLYYNVQIKNQNTPYENWTVVTYDGPNPKQTADSDFTNISLRIEGQWGVHSLAGTQTEIQVQAMLGDFYYGHSTFTSGFMFSGKTSDWSNTQTITIPANTPLSSTTSSPSSSTPDQTTEPTTNETSQTLQLAAILGTVVAVVVVSAFLLIYLKKRRKV
jgi:hypothetical protein